VLNRRPWCPLPIQHTARDQECYPQPSGFGYPSASSAGIWKISAVASRGWTLENRALPSRRKRGARSDIPGYQSWADRTSHVGRLSNGGDLIHPDTTPRLQATSSKQRLHAGRSQKSAAQGRPDKKALIHPRHPQQTARHRIRDACPGQPACGHKKHTGPPGIPAAGLMCLSLHLNPSLSYVSIACARPRSIDSEQRVGVERGGSKTVSRRPLASRSRPALPEEVEKHPQAFVDSLAGGH